MDVSNDDENECVICMERESTRVLECKHKFCKICIVKIVKNYIPICPLCRNEIFSMTSINDSDDDIDIPEILKHNKKFISEQHYMYYHTERTNISIIHRRRNNMDLNLSYVFTLLMILCITFVLYSLLLHDIKNRKVINKYHFI